MGFLGSHLIILPSIFPKIVTAHKVHTEVYQSSKFSSSSKKYIHAYFILIKSCLFVFLSPTLIMNIFEERNCVLCIRYSQIAQWLQILGSHYKLMEIILNTNNFKIVKILVHISHCIPPSFLRRWLYVKCKKLRKQ